MTISQIGQIYFVLDVSIVLVINIPNLTLFLSSPFNLGKEDDHTRWHVVLCYDWSEGADGKERKWKRMWQEMNECWHELSILWPHLSLADPVLCLSSNCLAHPKNYKYPIFYPYKHTPNPRDFWFFSVNLARHCLVLPSRCMVKIVIS